MAIKIMRPHPEHPSKYTGSDAYFFKGLEYAVSKGATVSNWSLGGGYIDDSRRTAYQNVASNIPEHLMVFSAGNYASLVTSTRYGCGLDLPNQICVASSTEGDERSSF